MKIIVTGGLGFIGSNFIRYIIRKPNIEVINIDAMKYGSNPKNVENIEKSKKYYFVKGDIANYDLVSSLVKDVDIIVNFAAETHVDRSISSPYDFLKSNIIGTFNILEAIKNTNPEIKLVHVSTDEVYGDIKKGSFKETDRLNPSSPYSATKASSDMLVLSYVKTYGVNAMITRCTNNYGPYQFPEKLIPKTIIRAMLNMRIPIYGKGNNIRDWIYVLDHCMAIEKVMKKGEKGEIYNISSGEEKTNLEVVKTILRELGKSEDLIEFVEDRPGHDIRYSLDSSKIREKLKWKPKTNFKKGIKKTVRWYINNKEWWKPLINEKVLSSKPWKERW